MGITTINAALSRIQHAVSPIAVHTCDIKDRIGAVFAETYETQRHLRKGWPEYIGSFNRDDDIAEVAATIRSRMA